MARKIENNVYDDSNSVMGTLFLTGLTAGGAYSAYNTSGAKDLGVRAYNKVFPLITPSVNDDSYLGRIQSAHRKILANRKNSLSMRDMHNYTMRETSDADTLLKSYSRETAANFDIINAQSTRLLERFTYENIDDVIDAGGNKVGLQVQQMLENITGEKVIFKDFNGTVGRFAAGNREINVPFAKFDPQTKGWVIRENHSVQVAPYMADTVNADGKVAMEMMDFNTFLVRNLSDNDRLTWSANQGFNSRDVLEMTTRNRNVDAKRLEAHLDKRLAGNVIEKVSDAFSAQRALNNMRNMAEHVNSTNTASMQRVSSMVKFDLYSRKILADKLGLPGFAATQVGADIANMAGDPSYTKEGFMAFYGLLKNVRNNPDLLSVATSQGVYARDAVNLLGVSDMAALAPSHLGWVLGQNHIAKGYAAIRELPTLMQAEANKSEKGLYFTRTMREYHNKTTNSKNAYFGLRHMPIHFDEAALPLERFTDEGLPIFKGIRTPYASSLASTIQNKGIQNVLASLDVYSDEVIALDTLVPSEVREAITQHIDMPFRPVENIPGEFEGRINKKHLAYTVLDGEERTFPIADLFSSPETRSRLISEDATVFIRKGSALGFLQTGGQILSERDMKQNIEHGKSIVRADSDLILNADHIRAIDAFNFEKEGKFTLFADRITDAKKAAAYGARWRSSLHHGVDSRISQISRWTGGGKDVEATISSKLFSKVVLNSDVAEKGSTELMQFLQASLHGHIWHYEKQGDVKLTGNALQSAKKYLNFVNDPAEGKWDGNLTQLLREGRLSFKTLTESADVLGEEFEFMHSMVGYTRDHFINNKKGDLILDSIDTKRGMDLFQEQWNLFNDDAIARREGFIQSLHTKPVNRIDKTAAVNEKIRQARSLEWKMTLGIMPQETMHTAQGSGFNIMNISYRDLSTLSRFDDVLAELSLSNINDSVKMAHELELLRMSWSGSTEKNDIRAWQRAEDAFKEITGADIPVYHKDDIVRALGGDPGIGLPPNWLDNMKASNEMFTNTFLSSDKNPNGFYVQDGKTRRYVASAEFYRGVYQLPEGTGTFDTYATQTSKMLFELQKNPESALGERTRDMFRLMTNSSMMSSTEGLSNVASLAIREAEYSINKESRSFLQDTRILKGLEHWDNESKGARNITDLLGSTIIQTREDFRDNIKQTLRTYGDLAGNNNTLAEVLTEHLGEDHAFSKFNLNITGDQLGEKRLLRYEEVKKGKKKVKEAVYSRKNELDLLTDEVMASQEKLAKQYHGAVKRYARSGFGAERIERLVGEAVSAFGVRHPNIYHGSYFTAVTLPDVLGELSGKKEVALGNLLKINTTGDTDGDKIMLKWLLGKGARRQSMENIKYTQFETKKWMEFSKKRPLIEAMYGDALKAQPNWKLSNVNMREFATTMLQDMPEATALSSFFTKSLTGTMNVKALTMKAYIRDLEHAKGLTEKHVSQMETYLGSTVSRFTEQAVISNKHLSAVIGGSNKMENFMDLVGNLRGKTGREAIIKSVRESQEINPAIQMAWGYMAGLHRAGGVPTGEEAQLAEAIETFMDLKTHARKVDEGAYKRMHTLFGEGDATAAWSRIQEGYTKLGEGGLETEAADMLGLKGKSFLRVMHESFSNKEFTASDNFEAIWKISQRAKKAGDFAGESNDYIAEMNRLVRDRFHYSTAQELLTSPSMSRLAPQPRRMPVGMDKLIEFTERAMKKITPLRAVGALAAGIVGLRVLNTVTGDGTPENPYDIPTVANQSFEGPRYNNLAAARSMSQSGNFNSSGTLLTDNTVSHDEALANASKNGIIRNGNNVSVRTDGHNPYKSDMMLYE